MLLKLITHLSYRLKDYAITPSSIEPVVMLWERTDICNVRSAGLYRTKIKRSRTNLHQYATYL